MPTIHGETDRGLHLLPALGAGQAAGLAVTAAAVWGLWRAHLPLPARVALGAAAGLCGAALTLGRWPPGAAGEPLRAWGVRLLRHRLQPRWWPPGRVAARLRVQDVRAGGLRLEGRERRVLLCGVRDHAGTGDAGLEAAQAAYVEFLHGLDAPIQVVSFTEPLGEGDRPSGWDPGRQPPALRDAAERYAAHWRESVAGVLMRRRCAVVLVAPPGGAFAGAAGQVLAETEAAFRALAERTGMWVAVPSEAAMTGTLRAMLGVSGGAPVPDPGGWSVRRSEPEHL